MKSTIKKIIVAILNAEAKVLLRRHNPMIIAITGSVGKTSTKDAIYTAIKDHVHARKSQKSFNSEIGVPLSVLGINNAWSNPIGWLRNIIDGFFIAFFSKEYPDVLVLETGVDRPGDMEALTAWLRPDVVVLTRFPDVPVHVEYFSTADEVVNEKMALVRALKDDGIVVYNHDDEIIRRAIEDVRQQAIGFSRYSPSQFTAGADRVMYDGGVPCGVEFSVSHGADSAAMRARRTLGVQHVYSYTAAAAVAGIFDIDLSAAAESLQEHTIPPGRMRILPGINSTLVIDDTYNSSPVAASRAVQTVSELEKVGRKIYVLGDMMELGQFSVREHENLGAQAAASADYIITLGVRSRKIAEGALEHGFSEKHILQYDDVERAGRELHNMLLPGDVVLVKASQGVRAERVVKAIMDNPDDAKSLLVRQSDMWQAR